jgi:hypothetical protein
MSLIHLPLALVLNKRKGGQSRRQGGESRKGIGAGHATQNGLKIHLQTRAPALSEISRILG